LSAAVDAGDGDLLEPLVENPISVGLERRDRRSTARAVHRHVAAEGGTELSVAIERLAELAVEAIHDGIVAVEQMHELAA